MSQALDPERQLALAYASPSARPGLAALWRLDVTLSAILAEGRDPLAAQLRLAWWRDSLQKLDREAPPAEPTLTETANLLVAAGLSGEWLSEMTVGWESLLVAPELSDDMLDRYASQRGGRLFEAAARILGAEADQVAAAGEAWALVDFARRSTDREESRAALEASRARRGPAKWPPRLRPIGMLYTLAKRDAARPDRLETRGSPRRMFRMLRHRFSGR